jgi:hypothetical protein
MPMIDKGEVGLIFLEYGSLTDYDMAMYLMAVKREKRGEISLPKAVEIIRGLKGVEVLDDPNVQRSVRVSVAEESYKELVKLLSAFCHIEPLIEHFTQRAGTGV